jgi:hypothetical protein
VEHEGWTGKQAVSRRRVQHRARGGRGPSAAACCPSAEQVTTQTSRGTTSVEFDVREPYPALKTIDYLMKALAERGWKVALPGARGQWRRSCKCHRTVT